MAAWAQNGGILTELFLKAEMKTVKKKVPKGTSDYQAAWILDSEEEVRPMWSFNEAIWAVMFTFEPHFRK